MWSPGGGPPPRSGRPVSMMSGWIIGVGLHFLDLAYVPLIVEGRGDGPLVAVRRVVLAVGEELQRRRFEDVVAKAGRELDKFQQAAAALRESIQGERERPV